MRLLKTVLLSTTLMMGATFGSAPDLTSGQPSAVNQGEVSAVFAKAQAAFNVNQKLVKGKLLDFLGRYVPEFAHTETVDSSSVKVLTALKGAFELIVQAKTAAETDLATALGRVQEVERAAAAADSQKEQVERQIAAILQEITEANEARAAAEEATRRVLGEKTAVEETLAGLQEKIQTADANSHAEVEQLKAQLKAEQEENARLVEELRTMEEEADDALCGVNEKIAAAIARGRLTAAANAGDDLLDEKYDNAFPLHAAGAAAPVEEVVVEAPKVEGDGQLVPLAAALAAVEEMEAAGKAGVDAIAAAATTDVARAAEIQRLQVELAAAQAIVDKGTPWTGSPIGPKKNKSANQDWQTELAYRAAQTDVTRLTAELTKLQGAAPAAAAGASQ